MKESKKKLKERREPEKESYWSKRSGRYCSVGRAGEPHLHIGDFGYAFFEKLVTYPWVFISFFMHVQNRPTYKNKFYNNETNIISCLSSAKIQKDLDMPSKEK